MSDWKNMDQWYTVLPPSRPTEQELTRIKDYLDSIDRTEPIAILGSTPEFRELIHRMGFCNRYIFEKSVSFYERMGKLVPHSVPDGEVLVVGNWLNTLSRWQNSFRVVLSDLTMGNIAYEDREKFYAAIADSISPNGVFIDKVLAFDFEVPKLRTLFEKYESLPINLRTINDFSSEVLFCSELVTSNCVVDSTKFYNFLRNGPYSEKIKYFSEAAHIITPEGFVWYYGIPWNELSEKYSMYYSSQRVFAEENPQSPYYHRTKQFFNTK